MTNIFVTCLLGGLLAGSACGGTALEQRIRAALPFTAQDWEKMDRGEAVGRILRSTDPKAIGILGAIRLPVSKEAYWKWYRRVDHFKGSDMVGDVAEIQSPAKAEDFARAALTPADLKSLRKCRPHACTVKLSVAELERFQKGVEWGTANEAASAASVARRWLLETTLSYQQHGDQALPVYDDKEGSLRVFDANANLVAASAGLLSLFPTLKKRLNSHSADAGKEDFFFWSMERYGFGLQSVLNVTHVLLDRSAPEALVICSKQVRATHYYEASLGITVLLDRPDGGSTMIYINRSRLDVLDDLHGFKRGVAEYFAPRTIRKQLNFIRRSVAGAGGGL